MKKNKINKRNIIITSIIVVIVLLIIFFAIYLNNYENNYTFAEKQWINSNNNKVIDISVKSDLPMFSADGNGVFYEYLDDLSSDTTLKFNIVSDGTSPFTFTTTNEINDTDVIFYEDEYVIISPSNEIITSLEDLSGSTLGVLAEDLSYISAYLNDRSGLTFTSYNTINGVIEGLNESIIYAIVPVNKYMNEILNNSFNIVYHMEDLNSYYILRFGDADNKLNSIMSKFFVRWSKAQLDNVYNKEFLDIYYTAKGLTEVQKESIVNDDFIVGYISNLPYEGVINRTFSGITSQYLNEFAEVTGASYKYVEYSNLAALKNAVDNKKVDIVLNNYNITSDNYSNSTSLGNMDYVVLSHKKNDLYLNTLNGLKNEKIMMLDNNVLYYTLKDNETLDIKTYASFKKMCKEMDEDSIIILPSLFYEYYKNTKLQDFTIRLTSTSKAYNTFLMNNDNPVFNNLFNFYLTMRSTNKVELRAVNISLEKVNGNMVVAFIVKYILYFIALGCSLIFVLFKLNKKVKVTKKINKSDKMMYLDVMTNLKNRNYLNENISYWNANKVYPQTIISIDLRNIKVLNDKYGHEEGDKQIKGAANVLIKTQRENSEIIRTDGDEFLIYLVGYDEKQILTYMHKLNKEFKNLPYPYGVSLGYSMITDDVKTIDDAINEALQMTRENKNNQGGNANGKKE